VVVEFHGEAVERRDYAATWRDQGGQVAATTWAGTMCLHPRLPGRLRIEHAGFSHILRCGECEGCINFDRRRLQDRLYAHYQYRSEGLWLVRIFADTSVQSALCHNLHRRPALALEPGFFRFGPDSVGILAGAKAPIKAALKAAGYKFRVYTVYLHRGARAFFPLTSGLRVAREAYGAQVKRYYARGLEAAERESWELVRLPYQKGYSWRTSPRAWTDDGLELHPPEVFQHKHNDKRVVIPLFEHNPKAAEISALRLALRDYQPAPARALPSIAAPKERLSREELQAWYQREAKKQAASAVSGSASEILPPLSEVGGYVSSVHTTSSETPKLLSDQALLATGQSGDPVWMEREREKTRLQGQREAAQRAKNQTWIEEWAERNAARAKDRGRGG
jgi:hypothetical protein